MLPVSNPYPGRSRSDRVGYTKPRARHGAALARLSRRVSHMARDTESQTGTVVARRVEAFHTRMIERAGLSTDRAADVMASQGEKILAATTVEQIWNADTGGTIQMRDVPNTVWQIASFEPVTSNNPAIENSRGYYMSCEATYLGGGTKEIVTQYGLVVGQTYALQTGADLVMYKLAMFEAADALPIRAMILGIKTAAGRTVVKLAEPPDMAMAGEAE